MPATAVALNWGLLGVSVNAGQVVGFVLLWAAIYALGRLRTVRDAPTEHQRQENE